MGILFQILLLGSLANGGELQPAEPRSPEARCLASILKGLGIQSLVINPLVGPDTVHTLGWFVQSQNVILTFEGDLQRSWKLEVPFTLKDDGIVSPIGVQIAGAGGATTLALNLVSEATFVLEKSVFYNMSQDLLAGFAPVPRGVIVLVWQKSTGTLFRAKVIWTAHDIRSITIEDRAGIPTVVLTGYAGQDTITLRDAVPVEIAEPAPLQRERLPLVGEGEFRH